MRRIVKCSILLAFLVLVQLTVAGQTEATQYFMTSLPEVSVNNPAFIPKYKYSIGLPLISSFGGTYTNNGFTYSDLVKTSGGTTMADLGRWNSALNGKNYLTASVAVDLARVGITIGKKVYIQLSSTAKEYSRVLIPREITSLIAQANAPLANSTNVFSPKAEGMTYIEYAASGAVKVTKRFTVGMRLKYLNGILDGTTINSNLTTTTSASSSITAAADVRVRTSGVYDADHHGYSFFHQFGNYQANKGGAMDVGATFQVSERIAVAASIVDFGAISWKNNTYDYVLNKATANYTFSGIDADKLVQGNSSYLSTQGDSIAKRFKFQEQKSGSYSTWLPGKLYLSGTYKLAKNVNAGMLLFTEKFRDRISQGVTGSVNANAGRWVSASVSYTVSNHSYNNFGMGVSFNLAPVQFYIVGDNLLNAPASLIGSGHINNYLNNTQVFSLRAGLNFVWKRDKESGAERVRNFGGRRRKTPGYIKARGKNAL